MIRHPITANVAFDLFKVGRGYLRQLREDGHVAFEERVGGDGRVMFVHERDDVAKYRLDGGEVADA